MHEFLRLALLFLVVAGLAFTALYRILRARRLAAERWRQAADELEPSEPPLLMGPWTPTLAAQIPMSQGGQKDLQQSLRAAGFYRPRAVLEYRALRSVLVVVPLLLGGVLALLASQQWTLQFAVGGLLFAGLGYAVPRAYVSWVARNRARQIERGLPFAIDLLTLALSAGQTTLGALRQVSHELRFTQPVLAEELDYVLQQATLLSLGHALQQLADRVPVPEVRSLALLLMQSERMGADAAAALMEFATYHRSNMRQRAEAQANRASFWMLFPSVMCLWVAGALVIVGPIYYDFWRQQGSALQNLKDAQGDIKKADNNRVGLGSRAAPAAPKVP